MRQSLLHAVLTLPLSVMATNLTPAGTVIRAIQPYAPVRRSPSSIKGLLQIRQNTCDPGFHACNDLQGGCCSNGQNCDLGGCCPIGQTCLGTSDQCTDSSLVLCPDKSGCCRPDETCVTDNTGTTSCQSGGSGGGGGGGGGGIGNSSPTLTTHLTTTNQVNIPTSPAFSQPPAVGSLPTASTGSTGASPTASAGQSMTTYAATDSRISYHGSWSTVSSSCTSNGRQTSTMRDTLTLMVPSASTIYINVDRTALVSFDVLINGNSEITQTNPNFNGESCAYNAITLPNTMSNVNVTVLVWGILHSGRRQVDSWTFKINDILVAAPTGSGSGGSSNTGSSGSTGTGAGFRDVQFSKSSWFGLGTLLVAGLAF